MSQINPKEVFHNTAYSVQPPHIAGHSFKKVFNTDNFYVFSCRSIPQVTFEEESTMEGQKTDPCN